MAETFEKAVLLGKTDEPLRDIAQQWARTDVHNTVTFVALRDRLLALEGKKRQVDAAQMSEVLMFALSVLGQSLWMNPRGTLALLDEYRTRATESE